MSNIQDLHRANKQRLEVQFNKLQKYAKQPTANPKMIAAWKKDLQAQVAFHEEVERALDTDGLGLEYATHEDLLNVQEAYRQRLAHETRELKRNMEYYRKQAIIAKEILRKEFDYNISLLNWMKPEDLCIHIQ